MTINYLWPDASDLTQDDVRLAIRHLWPNGPHGKREPIAHLHGQNLSLRVSKHYARGNELLLYVRRDEDQNAPAVDGVLAPVDGDLEELVVAVCAMVAKFMRFHARQWCVAADRLDPRPWLDQP